MIQDKAKTFQIGEHTILRDISRKTNEINENSKILYKYKTYVAENGYRPNLVLWNKYTGKKFPIPKDEIEYNPENKQLIKKLTDYSFLLDHFNTHKHLKLKRCYDIKSGYYNNHNRPVYCVAYNIDNQIIEDIYFNI